MAKQAATASHAGVSSALRAAVVWWRPHARQGAWILALQVVQQAYSAWLAFSLKLVVDDAVPHRDGGLLSLVLGSLAVGFVLSAAASVLNDHATARVATRLLNGIRTQIFLHLERLSIGYFSRAKAGDVSARFVSDISDLEKGLTERLVDAVCAVVGLAVHIPILFVLEWRLALLTLAALPLTTLGSGRFTGVASEAAYKRKKEEGALSSLLHEHVRSQPVIQAFNLQPTMRARFQARLDSLGHWMTRDGFFSSLVGTTSTLGVVLVQLVLVSAGAYLALRGTISIGVLVAVVGMLGNVTNDSYTLFKKVVPSLVKASGSLRRIDEVLHEPPVEPDAPNAISLPRMTKGLSISHVRFGYEPGALQLDDVSAEIRAGEYVGIVGASGSGKSTLVGLMLRLYEPSEGDIRLDDVPLRDATRDSLRAQCGVVFQDAFLLDGTVRENIALGRTDATEEDIVRAARAAEIHDDVMAFPNGYDTRIGELGGLLSGGQKQRLALARALVRDPAVLILDEATASLDAKTEAQVMATVERLRGARTLVFVTHRLEWMRATDRVLVMDQGRLVEQGTHDELVARRGRYHALWTQRAGDTTSRAELQPHGIAS